MSEKLNASFENHDATSETASTPEVEQPINPENQAEVIAEKKIDKAEAREKEARETEARKKEALEKLDKIHERPKDELDESAQSAAKIIRVPLQRLEPVVDSLAKTWGAIRQNLSPSEKVFSKVIHNPVIENISEFTAKTLARPYAILSGGIIAMIGSAIYLYYTRHLGYQYNYFIPILLFTAGLAVGLLVEMFYKVLTVGRRK